MTVTTVRLWDESDAEYSAHPRQECVVRISMVRMV